jgi:hypothetical protein
MQVAGSSQTPNAHQSSLTGTSPLDNDRDLRALLDTLYKHPYHMGNLRLVEHVQWVRSGNHYILVQMERAQGSGAYKPALLQCLGDLSSEHFRLYACAGWAGEHGPNDEWPNATPFVNAKATGVLEPPSCLALDATWKAYTDNLKACMHLPLPGDKDRHPSALCILEYDELPLRHAIFHVSSDGLCWTCLDKLYLAHRGDGRDG